MRMLINPEIVRKRSRQNKGRIKLPTLQPPKIGAHCSKGNCPGCYVLACTHECHRRRA